MCKNTLKTTKNIWKEKTKLKGKIIIQKDKKIKELKASRLDQKLKYTEKIKSFPPLLVFRKMLVVCNYTYTTK